MRIAIVNDMGLAVEALRRVLVDTCRHDLAWVAINGAQAVECCASDTPDLILMDLLMPVMDGVEATRQIMKNSPCAILVVTATVLGNSGKVFEAMAAGALDACQTPALFGKAGNGVEALLYKIDSIAKLIGRDEPPRARSPLLPAGSGRLPVPLIAIGASAGGPGALAQILGALPEDLAAGIVVIQHVDPQFVDGLADWLNTKSTLPLRVAREGDEVKPGTVLLAGGDKHLVFRDGDSLGYSHEPAESIYRPSVTVFFESVARHWKGHAIGVLLTGMGRDGASGLLTLRQTGHHTIAQDRASCAVYGMPKAAADLEAAVQVLSLDRVAQALLLFSQQTVTRKFP